MIRAGDLDRLVRIERSVADDAADGAGSGSWLLVDEVWAQIQDRLPSRGEQLVAGGTTASRPARVRMGFRTDVTADMRFVDGDRVMQIISAPAELGRREGLELMVEDYSAAGNTA